MFRKRNSSSRTLGKTWRKAFVALQDNHNQALAIRIYYRILKPSTETEKELSELSQSLHGFFVAEDANNLYCWLDWIIISGLSFSFIEQDLTRTHIKLKPIPRLTFMNYLILPTKQVESIISKKISAKFGLVFDGWSDVATSTHYITVSACYPDKKQKRKQAMLAFSPIPDETDPSAASHVNFISETLRVYQKDNRDVQFLVADNATVNQKNARDLDITLIG